MNNVLSDLGANLHAAWMTNQFAVRARSRIDVSFSRSHLLFFFLLLLLFLLHILLLLPLLSSFFPLPSSPFPLPSSLFLKPATAFVLDVRTMHQATTFRLCRVTSIVLLFVSLINLLRFSARYSSSMTPSIVSSRLLFMFDRIRGLVARRIRVLFPFSKGKEEFWIKTRYGSPSRNLFRVTTNLVSGDWVKVLVYCKSKLLPGVRDIAQDRL